MFQFIGIQESLLSLLLGRKKKEIKKKRDEEERIRREALAKEEMRKEQEMQEQRNIEKKKEEAERMVSQKKIEAMQSGREVNQIIDVLVNVNGTFLIKFL